MAKKFKNLQDVDDWIQNQKQMIRNPDEDPELEDVSDIDLELDEGQQAQLQLLEELENLLDGR